MPERDLYSPIPTVRPTEAKTPAVSVAFPDVNFSDAIGRALGDLGQGYHVLGSAQGQVGAALASMGGSLKEAGNEIFARATAIKHIENDTAATEARAKYHIEGSKMQEAFEASNGNAATKSLDAHMKGLEDLRQRVRGTLNNDEARNMYDQHSLLDLGHMVASAGKHAANQGRSAAIAAAQSEEALQLNDIMLRANDPGFDFEKEAETAMDRYRNKIADLEGDFGPKRELKERELWSKLYASWVKGVGKTDPGRAYEILEDAKNKKRILFPAYEQAQAGLQTKDIDIASRSAAVRAVEGLKDNKTEEERLKEPTKEQVVDKALKELHEHPRLNKDPETKLAAEQITVKRAEFEYDDIMRRRKNAMDQARRSIQAVGMGIGSPTGERPRTMEEFEAMGGQKAMADLSMLPLKEQRAFRERIMSGEYFDSVDVRLAHEVWKAKADDDKNPSAVKEVLEHDFFKEKWPIDRIIDMFKRQEKIMRGEHKNIALNEAMRVAAPLLPATMNSRDDPDKYYSFRNAMTESILAYQQTFHTVPNNKQIQEITKEWLKQESKGRFWGRMERFQMDSTWRSRSEELYPNMSEADRMHEYRLEKATQMLKALYGKQIPEELPAMKWVREHGGFGQ